METYILIDNNRLKISPSAKLIKAESYSTIVEADDILSKVKARADQILQTAREDARTIERDAKSAYTLEFEKGYNDGLKKAKQEMASQISATILKSEHYIHNFEEKIAALVLDTVRKVIAGIDQMDLISALIKKALTTMKHQKNIKLKVSPLHIDFLNDRISEILISLPYLDGIEVIADERLTPNQLVMESPIGIVDASIETQLAAIQDAFSRCFPQNRT
jgi:type III secretion protein L